MVEFYPSIKDASAKSAYENLITIIGKKEYGAAKKLINLNSFHKLSYYAIHFSEAEDSIATALSKINVKELTLIKLMDVLLSPEIDSNNASDIAKSILKLQQDQKMYFEILKKEGQTPFIHGIIPIYYY